MANNPVGDIADLHRRTIIVPATQPIVGHHTTGAFKLADNLDIAYYLNSYATVSITGPIVLEIVGPVSATIATSVIAAIYPDKYNSVPTTREHVRRLEGSVTLQHSLIVGSVTATCLGGREVSTSLKPRTLVDFPPVVAYHVDIAGGNNTSPSVLVAHVPLLVDGISHRCTW